MKNSQNSQLNRGRCTSQPKKRFTIIDDETEMNDNNGPVANDEQHIIDTNSEKQTDIKHSANYLPPKK